MYQKRIEKVLVELEKKGISQMIVSDPNAIGYLTGVWVTPGERLYGLYINRSGNHTFILNKLFRITPTDLDQIWLFDTDDGIDAIAGLIDGTQVLGVDKTWPARFLLPLIERVEGLTCKVTSKAVDDVREVKDEGELELMRISSRINDEVMTNAMAFIKEGTTELEVSNFIKNQYVERGCTAPSFPPMVGFGDSGSDPHYQSGERVIQPGDTVLIDTGCEYQHYASDMTRTFFYKGVNDHQREIYDIVLEANLRAIKAIRPGMRFCELDNIARSYIAEKGYGEYFTHRLGHCIGLECHECGDVNSTNTDVLRVGAVFSIEPGIYLPGDIGVRIEDLLVVTEDGCENLNAIDKGITIVGND